MNLWEGFKPNVQLSVAYVVRQVNIDSELVQTGAPGVQTRSFDFGFATGLSYKDDVLPGPIKLHSKAATVWERAMDAQYESDRAIALVAACALAARGRLAAGAFPARGFPCAPTASCGRAFARTARLSSG